MQQRSVSKSPIFNHLLKTVPTFMLLFIAPIGPVPAQIVPPILTKTESVPPPPTKNSMASDWLKLWDGESTFGWQVQGNATIENKQLTLGGASQTTLTSTSPFLEFELEITTRNTDQLGVMIHKKKIPLKFSKFNGEKQTFRITCMNRPEKGVVQIQELKTDRQEKNAPTETIELNEKISSAEPIQLRIGENQKAHILSLRVHPLNLKPIFNHKDLTGWKIFAGEKYRSQFSVSANGELQVKNGPGDLQTTGEYGNFVLQLDCQTLGKNLNSGIFFRCNPDLYQQGYEMQIHNGYKEGDRKKPIDFGTGAIYRRQPARMIVSNDHEWFTMTLIASGNHFATWVNGYQVTDWVDNRPAKANPRQGLKLGKGHLSIQGHDPTTNILFRNIRLTSWD